ncbi:MAG: hypothetical protein Q8S29_17570 [Phreatobacter sp.]|nr:hypothetical protein [Phreatobacter sp.]
MTSTRTRILAAAALAIVGTVGFAMTEAEARGGRGGGGGFHGGGGGGGFRGGGMGGFRGGFHGHRGFHRHGGFHRPWHHGHRHWRHRHFGYGVAIGAPIAACGWVRQFDPAYGIYRRVQVCN